MVDRAAGGRVARTALLVALGCAACGTGATDTAPANAAPVPGVAPVTPTPTTLAPDRPSTTAAAPVSSTGPSAAPATTALVVPATTEAPPSSTTTTPPSTTDPTATDPTATAPTTTVASTADAPTSVPVEDAVPDASAPTPASTVAPLPSMPLPLFATAAAFTELSRRNPAVSLTVVRDRTVALSVASGQTIDGAAAVGDTPMVVASVSKVLTALAVIRLHQQGALAIGAPVPWTTAGLSPHAAWTDVTVRDLLDHTSGMPVVRTSWFDGAGDCASYLPTLIASPPQGHRGGWRYSNGNYCALGLLVEGITGEPIHIAIQRLVFDPLGAGGVHSTLDGQLPGDVGYPLDVARLSRLGGAGTLIVSTDDIATALALVGTDDVAHLTWPGVAGDQYGYGHTGTVTGAKACVWVLESGRTVVAATVAGEWPSTGGGVCDRIVPALATDLGIGAGPPNRTPPGPPPA